MKTENTSMIDMACLFFFRRKYLLDDDIWIHVYHTPKLVLRCFMLEGWKLG